MPDHRKCGHTPFICVIPIPPETAKRINARTAAVQFLDIGINDRISNEFRRVRSLLQRRPPVVAVVGDDGRSPEEWHLTDGCHWERGSRIHSWCSPCASRLLAR